MIKSLLPKISAQFDYFQPNAITSYVNLYNYLILRKNPEVVYNIDRFTLDGIAMVRLLNLFGKKAKRMSPDFSSYFSKLFLQCEQQQKSMVFVGGSEKDIHSFKTKIQIAFPNLQILQTINGYFEIQQNEPIAREILKLNPNVVILGLGTPKQEYFSILLKSFGYQGSIYTCGALISQTALKGTKYYPKIINTLHLRWLYRIFKEKNLLKRYFVHYPHALLIFFKDYIRT